MIVLSIRELGPDHWLLIDDDENYWKVPSQTDGWQQRERLGELPEAGALVHPRDHRVIFRKLGIPTGGPGRRNSPFDH
jgi:hypothetical protein